jgi:hypothetical protein
MAITSLDGLIGAPKQRVQIVKTATRSATAGLWHSVFDLAGTPGAGTLAGANTTTGVVPTDSTAGVPLINAFGAGNTGHITGVDFSSSTACRIMLFDLLWKGGAYNFNAITSGNTPASYASRVPGGTDFTNTEIWYEQVTVGTGTQSVAVVYNNQGVDTNRSTGTIPLISAVPVGRMYQLPLQAGDSGVKGITGVIGTVATGGTFNILVIRPLWVGRVPVANAGDIHDYLRVGMPTITDDAALAIAVLPDFSSTGMPEVFVTIANG